MRIRMRDDPRMQIWVDADACPSVIKDILFRAAARVRVPVTLVANRWLAMPRSPWIRSVQVAGGFHVADREIVARMTASDVVVTADIHLPRWSSRRAAWLSIPEASCTPTPTSANTLRGATSWTSCAEAASTPAAQRRWAPATRMSSRVSSIASSRATSRSAGPG
jgi:hypothetical protein